MKTYYCVRSDTRQIFDAVGRMPSEKYLRDYSLLYGCEITVIEGATVKEYNIKTDTQSIKYVRGMNNELIDASPIN